MRAFWIEVSIAAYSLSPSTNNSVSAGLVVRRASFLVVGMMRVIFSEGGDPPRVEPGGFSGISGHLLEQLQVGRSGWKREAWIQRTLPNQSRPSQEERNPMSLASAPQKGTSTSTPAVYMLLRKHMWRETVVAVAP